MILPFCERKEYGIFMQGHDNLGGFDKFIYLK